MKHCASPVIEFIFTDLENAVPLLTVIESFVMVLPASKVAVSETPHCVSAAVKPFLLKAMPSGATSFTESVNALPLRLIVLVLFISSKVSEVGETVSD